MLLLIIIPWVYRWAYRRSRELGLRRTNRAIVGFGAAAALLVIALASSVALGNTVLRNASGLSALTMPSLGHGIQCAQPASG